MIIGIKTKIENHNNKINKKPPKKSMGKMNKQTNKIKE
jgi:hypothetical protein